jgi:signal peptidase I
MPRRRTVVIACSVIALLAVVMVFGTYSVSTSSMTPTVIRNSVVIANHWSYQLSTKSLAPFFFRSFVEHRSIWQWSHPKHGDVVVFTFPGYRDEATPRHSEVWLKRVVACAGETIIIRNDSLIVNGTTARVLPPRANTLSNEAYSTFPKGALYTLRNYGPLRVPRQGDTLWLGSAAAWDAWATFIAREHHSVNAIGQKIDGAPASHYVVERDYAFCLGDNNAESVDSRMIGPIAYDDIFGRMTAAFDWPFSSSEQ